MNLEKKIPKASDFKAVIFDMDGTLLDSMWLWYQIDIDYLARFGYELPEGLQQCIEGKSFSETAVYIKERFQIPDSIEQMEADWNEMALHKYQYEVPLKEGSENFLRLCKEQGIKLGVATSNSRRLVDVIVEKFHLDRYFDCILTASEIKKGKPNPDIYLSVAEKLSVSPKDCLVFEDVIPGIMAGKNAGMQVCAVEDVYSRDIRDDKLKEADYFIDSYLELLE